MKSYEVKEPNSGLGGTFQREFDSRLLNSLGTISKELLVKFELTRSASHLCHEYGLNFKDKPVSLPNNMICVIYYKDVHDHVII